MRSILLLFCIVLMNISLAQNSLIGLTPLGGTDSLGALIQVDSAGNNLVPINYIRKGIPGYTGGNLVEDSVGRIYGYSVYGTNNTFFRYDRTTGEFEKLHYFSLGDSLGYSIVGNLTVASNGLIYGRTSWGGLYNKGVLFSYNTQTNTFIIRKQCSTYMLGHSSIGSMHQHPNGKYYGIYERTSAATKTFIYQYNLSTNTVTILDSINGKYLSGMDNAGLLYLVKIGSSSGVLLYRHNVVTNVMTTMVSIPSGSAVYGDNVNAMCMGNGNTLYITTTNYASGADGALLKYDIASAVLTNVHSYSPAEGGSQLGLICSPGGKVYSSNLYGQWYEYDSMTGIFSVRTGDYEQRDIISIYRSTLSQELIAMSSRGPIMIVDTVLYRLRNLFFIGTGTVGTNKSGGLKEGPNGKYYILCTGSGGYGNGTIAEYDPVTNALIDKVSLNYTCWGDLSYMSGGDFYFTTFFGLSKYNCYTHAVDTAYVWSGYGPSNTPSCFSNGKIYGVAPNGGGGDGSIYEYDPVSNTAVTIHIFNGYEGKRPDCELVLGSDGYYYGTTKDGGGPFFTNDYGVIFKFNPMVPGSFVEVNDLNYSTQYHDPYGKLLSSGNNMWSIGNNKLYKLDILTTGGGVVYDFTSDSLNGYEPSGYLTLSSNGKIYGVTNKGGLYDKGVLFEFDTLAGIYSKKFDFDVINGAFLNSAAINIFNWHLAQVICPLPTMPAFNETGFVNKCIGSSFSFYATNVISSALTYSWYKDGVLISTSINDTLKFNNLAPSDSGYYVLQISNACGAFVYSDTIKLNSTCDVWPGDSENNNIVDNNDLLPIGLYYGQSGSLRSSISNLWQAWPSTDWGVTQANGQDIKHADCNGDGVVNNNDTLAVNLNFSLTHAFAPTTNDARSTTPNIYLVTSANSYLPGDWVDAEVWLGSSALPVNDLYGIAFNINYDASLVQPGSESLTYPNSWLGTPGLDAIKLSKIDGIAAKAYGAETRITQTNVDGFGKIADFKFQLKNTIAVSDSLNLSVSYYNAIDSAGNPVLFNTQDLTLSIPVGILEQEMFNDIKIFPNPYSAQTQISYSLKSQSDVLIEVYNPVGQIIETLLSGNQSKGEYTLPFSSKQYGYKGGLYFVKITIGGRSITKRIVEIR